MIICSQLYAELYILDILKTKKTAKRFFVKKKKKKHPQYQKSRRRMFYYNINMYIFCIVYYICSFFLLYQGQSWIGLFMGRNNLLALSVQSETFQVSGMGWEEVRAMSQELKEKKRVRQRESYMYTMLINSKEKKKKRKKKGGGGRWGLSKPKFSAPLPIFFF